jgi:hypothetical protein
MTGDDASPAAPPPAGRKPAKRRLLGALLVALVCAARASAGDADPDAGKVVRGKGFKPPVPGGAVIVDASGNRLEIVPAKRARPAAPLLPATPALPELPALDDPKAGLAERRRRAQLLLAGSAAGAVLLVAWARRRWRPDV